MNSKRQSLILAAGIGIVFLAAAPAVAQSLRAGCEIKSNVPIMSLVGQAKWEALRSLHKGGAQTFSPSQPQDCVNGNPQVEPFSCGSTTTGQLTSADCFLQDNSYYDAYSFSGTSGQRVTITMSSSAIDSYLFLLDPSGTTAVAQDDDSGGGASGNDAQIVFTLTQTGTWFIVANAFDASTFGAYTLQLVCDTAAPADVVTLPAAASLHGAPPTFFHSDVSVFNPSATQSATVTARYRCFTGACGNSVQTFTVEPRQMRVFEDIVGTLFGAPETGGAVEFSGNVLVDSRLYTPSRPAPTVGMYVPGLAAGEAYVEAVLTSLSYSSNLSTGFRTNVGVYNGNDVAQTVTFTLYNPQGVQIGQTSQLVPARTPLQINNIAGFVGITTDVPSFYCVVRGDGVRKNYAYAAVLDNQSQDLIFVKGARATLP